MANPTQELLASLRKYGWQEDDFGDYYRGYLRVRIRKDRDEVLVGDSRTPQTEATMDAVGARAWVVEKSKGPVSA